MDVIADGNVKFTILTTPPANPAAPTATELNAGIDASCLVAQENFSWTAADSDRTSEKKLCASTNAEGLGAGNSNLAMTVYRVADPATGVVDPVADELFEAVRERGTELYGYTRVNGKAHSAAWAAADEFDYGAKFITDNPQLVGPTGSVKYVIPCLPQDAWTGVVGGV